MKLTGLFVVLLGIAAVVSSSVAKPPPSSENEVSAVRLSVQALLQETALSQTKEIEESLEWMDHLVADKTCVQVASMQLVKECGMFENANAFAHEFPELYLADVKKEYAARLAICEIVIAQPNNPTPPKHCEHLYPTVEACEPRFRLFRRSQPQNSTKMPCYPNASKRQDDLCWATIRGTNQYWTSFSNAFQNAAKLCQMSRHAIERQTTLELYQKLTMVTSDVHSAMADMGDTQRAFQAEFSKFTVDVRTTNGEATESMRALQNELKEVRETAVSNIISLNNGFDSFMKASMAQLSTAVAQGSDAAVDSIRTEMMIFSQGLTHERTELAAAMSSDLHALQAEFQNAYQQVYEQALFGLQMHSDTATQSLNTLSASMDDTHRKNMDNANELADRSTQTIEKMDKIIDLLPRIEGMATAINGLVTIGRHIFDFVTIVASKQFGFVVLLAISFYALRAVRRWFPITTLLFFGCLYLLAGIYYFLNSSPSKYDPVFESPPPNYGPSLILLLMAGLCGMFITLIALYICAPRAMLVVTNSLFRAFRAMLALTNRLFGRRGFVVAEDYLQQTARQKGNSDRIRAIPEEMSAPNEDQLDLARRRQREHTVAY